MKLVRYGRAGKEKPGLIDADGKLRDLSARIDDITPDQLSDKSLAKLSRINPARLPLVKGKPRFGPPLTGIRQPFSENANDSVKKARARSRSRRPDSGPPIMLRGPEDQSRSKNRVSFACESMKSCSSAR